MNSLTLMKEIAALSGYSIDGSSNQDISNKARALRRLNIIKDDITARYGAKWNANYREGWLPLVPLYNTGTISYTLASRTVTGNSTVWTSSMKGSKILINRAYYKIASVTNGTTLILSQPCQEPSLSLQTYQIWKDEYRLYPEVQTIGGFVDYFLPQIAVEKWSRDMKDSYPLPVSNDEPNIFTLIGREVSTTPYITGSISGTSGSNIITGATTSWLDNVEPGFEIVIGTDTYHVKKVNSDTEIELYQFLKSNLLGVSYSATGKNAIIVRFKQPTSQRIVNYWYWAKSYPLVSDYDEDWICELYPEVVINGAVVKDYMDKNDYQRLSSSKQMYEDSIKSMRVSEDGGYTGVRTLGYYVPPEARY